jgi:hypothetical protein
MGSRLLFQASPLQCGIAVGLGLARAFPAHADSLRLVGGDLLD